MSRGLAIEPLLYFLYSKRKDKEKMVSDLLQIKKVADSLGESSTHRSGQEVNEEM